MLLTGEPGAGKTELATHIHHVFKEEGKIEEERVLTYCCKTTSIAKDTLYYYDSISQFADANARTAKNTAEYIKYQALGKALINAQNKKWSIILIDEIDKAPRDFPNDLLNEIDKYSFIVSETNEEYKGDIAYKPLIIITSNEEKLLPDAFLRRCLYFNIHFPDENQLMSIVKNRIKNIPNSVLFGEDKLAKIISKFLDIRKILNKKKPSTSDLLDWINLLLKYNFDIDNLDKGKEELSEQDKDVIQMSLSILAKHTTDFKELQNYLDRVVIAQNS